MFRIDKEENWEKLNYIITTSDVSVLTMLERGINQRMELWERVLKFETDIEKK